jgi:HAE1 family hydrophobic/amphiphilic exporter-1
VTLSRTLRDRVFGKAGAPERPEEGEGFRGGAGMQKPLEQALPEGVQIQVVSDQAEFIQQAISNLKSAAVGGGLLAVLVLFFFLKRFGPTLVVALSIPFSVVATFAAMYLSGVTLNIMSLGGLALGVGMLVDNAIVVLESIARCREEGDAPRTAALRGVREVGMAVSASTLTTVAVFFPIVFVEGIAGQVFRDLSLTVVFSLLASLAMSLFFIPTLLAREWAPSQAAGERSLARSLFVPEKWSAARERISGAPGALSKAARILGTPFFLALGEPLWPAGRLPGRPEEGGGAARRLARRYSRLLTVPAWLLFRLAMGLLSVAVGVLGYLLRLVLAGGELAALWASGLGIWLAGKVLARPLRWFDTGFDRLVASYRSLVRVAMQRPFRVVAGTVLAFLFLLVSFGFVDTELIPQLHNRTLQVETNLPVGTPLEVTDQTVRSVAERIRQLPGVEEVALQSGVAKDDLLTTEGGEFSAKMTVVLTRKGSLRRMEDRAVKAIRAVLADVPDLKSKVRFPSLFSTRTPVEVEVYANDLGRLQELNRQALSALSGIPGLTDLQTSLSLGNPEIQIRYDRGRLSQYGLDIATVASLVRTKVLGQVESRFDKGREKVDIRVQLRPEDRSTLTMLGDLVVNPGAPLAVPLSAVAELGTGVGPSEIRRVNQQRVAVISANLRGAGLRSVSGDIGRALVRLPWRPEEGFRVAGQKDEMDRSSRSLVLALVLSIFLVYLVMASQFESLLHPFLIMFTIPLALVGVLIVLLLFQIPLSILVFIGMIMLAGVVVNNAIVLVDYVNQLRARGQGLESALEEGGVVRMRPILMTTLTTLLGLLPLAVGLGAGSELQSPMAITVMAGLTCSTLLTLVVIPTLYFIAERRRAGRDPGSQGGPQAPAAGTQGG